MAPRLIALLTDYGYSDPFAGILRAVIASEDPAIPVIDLSHGVTRHDVVAGAVALADSAPYLPRDSVVVAVVDPGVGGDRRAVAVEAADGRLFVGPDNGLLSLALDACGGAARAVDIGESDWRLPDLAHTFDGRDIFAPVAARLAIGAPLADAGSAIEPVTLQTLALAASSSEDGILTTSVLAIDGFGNARLAADPTELTGVTVGDAVEIEIGDGWRAAVFARTFGDALGQDPLLIADSSGSLALVVNQGSAAEQLNLEPGTKLRIQKADR